MNFLPFLYSKSGKFYGWFEEAAENNVLAAKALLKLCKKVKDAPEISQHIHDLEHKGDKISHLVYDELNRVFVPPIDSEDIISLTHSLDDVVDLIYASASRIDIYSIKKIDAITFKLANVIVEGTQLVEKTLPKLRNRRTLKDINLIGIQINKLENKADLFLKDGLRNLFKDSHNAKDIICLKDVYEKMEEATDALEDIADVLHGIVTKYA